jgi:hypothetical protein
MRMMAQGLICHANYWVKCPNGLEGHWILNTKHILITVGAAVVGIYVMFKLFRIIK